ncbi:MAG: crotonase/enoyl-CoA hydratase family protein [Actinomycetia bacterium]|nr:crotonase/enoyl-CoA hydratase family protein [Actinomycetes bacterium]
MAVSYRHIQIETEGHVGWLWLNRPRKMNAFSPDLWEDLPRAVQELSARSEVRVIVVAGRGRAFTVGIDLNMLAGLAPAGGLPAAIKRALFRRLKELQKTFSSLESCPVPVIAAVHGWCLGAGMDLITACDIRLAASDAVFSVRETRMAMVADMGTLERLPKVVSSGHVAELVYTGKDIDAARAEQMGLVNQVYDDRESLISGAADWAGQIAANSPLAVQGAKAVLSAERGLSVSEALDYVALWNTAFLESDDLNEAVASFMERRPPRYTGN